MRIEGVTDPKKKLLALMLRAKHKKEQEELAAKEKENGVDPNHPRPGYDPHRQNFAMMYVIWKDRPLSEIVDE